MIKTRMYNQIDLTKVDVQQDIRTTLQQGKNVVFPTETVYGIGANALSEEGIKNIYKIKGRPSDNPLIMHVAHSGGLEQYVDIKQDYVYNLIDAFWPGPLTLVFDKKDIVPDYFTGGLQTVGVRVPGSEIARRVIEIAEVPVCAPSANISGRPSATLFKHVVADFNNKVDILIDGGKSLVGIESTVVDVTKSVPVILRPGMITYEMIKHVTGQVIMSGELEHDEHPKAPGMKYRHYAPHGELLLVEGDMTEVIAYINKQIEKHHNENRRVGVITTHEYNDQFDTPYVFELGMQEDERTIASNVFAALREMDEQDVDYIYSLSFTGPYSEAIMNRLIKAANHNIIKL